MKRLAIILAVLAVACTPSADNRYFAPEVSFSAAEYRADAASAGVDVTLSLSRPATLPFEVKLVLGGSLTEGMQYTLASRSVQIAEGETQKVVHIGLAEDQIWVPESTIDITLMPGTRYTVNPSSAYSTRVVVTRDLPYPILNTVLLDGDLEMNPYRPGVLRLKMTTVITADEDLSVDLVLDGLTAGEDYLLDGPVILPAGARETAPFEVSILKKDISGYDKTVTIGAVTRPAVYVAGTPLTLHLSDPVPDFTPLWRTRAQVGDKGYQLRQAILKTDGEWDNGPMAGATIEQAAAGSCYLSSVQNTETTYGCISIAVGGHALRIPDFFPTLRTTENDLNILGYGNNYNTRAFSPVDSLFRFILDKGSTTQGDLTIERPRTFSAFKGSRSAWEAGAPKAWVVDSNATGGDIFKSTSPILTGRIDVVLERLEGRFDLTAKELVFSAWFSCTDPAFMDGVDLTTVAAVKEGDLWKVDYKLFPR